MNALTSGEQHECSVDPSVLGRAAVVSEDLD